MQTTQLYRFRAQNRLHSRKTLCCISMCGYPAIYIPLSERAFQLILRRDLIPSCARMTVTRRRLSLSLSRTYTKLNKRPPSKTAFHPWIGLCNSRRYKKRHASRRRAASREYARLGAFITGTQFPRQSACSIVIW